MPLTFRRLQPPLVLAAVLALLPAPARAACSVSGSGPAFGAYSSESAAPTDVVGTISVVCGGLIGVGISYEVQLMAGGGSVADRRLAGPGGGTLAYQLFTDAARTRPWGDGNGGTTVLRRSVLLQLGGISDSIPVYGRLLARQRVPAGGYADAVAVLLIY